MINVVGYIHLITGEYPITEAGLRSAHPDTLFPADLGAVDLSGFHVARVYASARPVHDAATEKAVEGLPVVVDSEHVQTWTVVQMTDIEIAERLAALGPIRVTPWQMRKALNQMQLREAVEAAVAASDQTTQDAWQYATEIVRTDPLVAAVRDALGKTDADLDALFGLAQSL